MPLAWLYKNGCGCLSGIMIKYNTKFDIIPIPEIPASAGMTGEEKYA